MPEERKHLGIFSCTESFGVGGCAGAFEPSVRVVVVFRVIKNGEGFFAVERKARLQMFPFVIIDLNNELLSAPIMAAVGSAVLLFQIADLFFKFPSFYPPRDEDRMGITVDKAEFFSGGFEAVGLKAGRIWRKAGFTRDDMLFVPIVRFGAGLPDGVLEVGADEFRVEKIAITVIWKNL